MASARKKSDEKNLKILRELVSFPENKNCFDCHQRGPTYVNVTIGSFVCTTCSGLLRGLTPPHRVKSISMATFTTEELELLKCRGNEYCRKTWLSLFDGEEFSKDEQQIKEFMISKYERKRYYVKSSDSDRGSNHRTTIPSSSVLASNKLPILSNVSSMPQNVNNNVNRNYNNNLFTSYTKTPKPKELVNIIDQDPFNSFNFNDSMSLPTDNFANFDNNPIFNSSSEVVSVPHSQTNTNQTPGEDKYAALKDLDSLMKSQTQQATETATTGWDPNSPWPVTSDFPQNNAFETSTTKCNDSNPFSLGNNEVSWSNNQIGNPFNIDYAWSPANGQIISQGLSSVQPFHYNSNKQNNFISTPNPFTGNSNGENLSQHPSSNPFL